MIKLKTLKPNPNNPRIIKDDNFFKLVASIEQFPQMMALRPLVVDEKNTVLGGNMRLKALQHLAYKEIDDSWVIKASDLTDGQKEEFAIKDNVHLGTWNTEELANNWEQAKLSEWGVEVATWNMPPEPLDGGEEHTGEPASRSNSPRATDDEFSVFELVMYHENKKRLLEVLNSIKDTRQLDKLEDALMHLANTHTHE